MGSTERDTGLEKNIPGSLQPNPGCDYRSKIRVMEKFPEWRFMSMYDSVTHNLEACVCEIVPPLLQ